MRLAEDWLETPAKLHFHCVLKPRAARYRRASTTVASVTVVSASGISPNYIAVKRKWPWHTITPIGDVIQQVFMAMRGVTIRCQWKHLLPLAKVMQQAMFARFADEVGTRTSLLHALPHAAIVQPSEADALRSSLMAEVCGFGQTKRCRRSNNAVLAVVRLMQLPPNGIRRGRKHSLQCSDVAGWSVSRVISSLTVNTGIDPTH